MGQDNTTDLQTKTQVKFTQHDISVAIRLVMTNSKVGRDVATLALALPAVRLAEGRP